MASVRGRVAIGRAGRRMITLGKGKAGGSKGKTGGRALVTAPAPAPNLGGAMGPESEEKS